MSDEILVLNSGTVKKLSVPEHKHRVLLQAQGAAVRWRIGDDPTSSVGNLVAPGGVLVLSGADMGAFRAIEASGPAVLVATYANVDVSDDLQSSVTHITSAEFARPANTIAYGSLQSINNSTVQANVSPMEFTAVSEGGKAGHLIKARLITNNSNFPIPIRLWLYTVSPTNISADGSQFLLQWTNRATRIGFVDFPPLSTEGAGSDSSSSLNDWVDLPFKCAAGSTKLYGVLETRASGAATPPTSGQLFFVELMFEER